MVMIMSVDIKYRKCIVTVTCLFCVNNSLWYFVYTFPYGILCAHFLMVFCVHSYLWYFVCTDVVFCLQSSLQYFMCTVPYDILCAQFLMVFCVWSSLWYFVCGAPCGILFVELLVVFCVQSYLWYFVCGVPCGILCVKLLVVFCVHSSLWYFVCGATCGILFAQFLMVFCVRSSLYFVCSSLWYYHYQHNNCTSVVKTCYSHVFLQVVLLCLFPFSLHLCWCRLVCPGYSRLLVSLFWFFASVILCTEPTSNAKWVTFPSL
jgi:hypothetical protein